MPPRTNENTPLCGRRVKTCRKCKHRYTKAEYELWKCPQCGEDRHCVQPSFETEPGRPCLFHGGKTPRGIDSPSFVTGKHSKFARFLPQRFEDIFAAMSDDPLDLTQMTKVMVARFWDVISRAHRGESEELLQSALKFCDDLDEAQQKVGEYQRQKAAAVAANDPAGAAAAQAQIDSWSQRAGQSWNNLKASLKQGVADWQTWNNALDVGLKATRVAESQRKRLVEEKLMMGIDAVQKLYFAMASAVNRNVQQCTSCHHDLAENRRNVQKDFKSIALHGLGTPDMNGGQDGSVEASGSELVS